MVSQLVISPTRPHSGASASHVYSPVQKSVLVALVFVKIAITIFNIFSYNNHIQYDREMHLQRLSFCGLQTSERLYNPPLYYMLACPAVVAGYVIKAPNAVEESVKMLLEGQPLRAVAQPVRDVDSVAILRDVAVPWMTTINLLMIAVFYVAWVFYICPQMLKSGLAATICSIIILSLPGYQKIAAMVHPDNLLIFATTVTFWWWLRLYRHPKLRLSDIASLCILLAILALSRPFAIVPVGCFTLALLYKVWNDRTAPIGGRDWRRLFLTACMIGAIVGTSGASWWVYRAVVVGDPFASRTMNEERREYLSLLAERQEQFDYVSYYTTVYPAQLFATPNRHFGPDVPIHVLESEGFDWQSRRNNSFWTLLFSETWGDHWLYFSGGTFREKAAEEKADFKRALFVVAGPVSLALCVLFIRGGIHLVRNVHRLEQRELWLLAAAIGVGGFLIFVFWQGVLNLQPGRNSGVKFVYFAFAVPFLLLIAHAKFPKAKPAAPIGYAASLALFVFALPIALYW